MKSSYLALLLVLPLVLRAEPSRPNILFAIADDWGLHAGAYGTPWVRTPCAPTTTRSAPWPPSTWPVAGG